MNKKLHKNMEEEVDRLVSLKGKDNWAKIRTSDNFNLIQRNYSFGIRYCYEKKEKDDPVYVDLQSSRGIGILEDDSIERILSQIDDSMKLSEADLVRINEIETIRDHPELDLKKNEHTGFVELGFRVPKLMKYYKENYGASVWGYDISPLSVSTTKSLGYDARTYDFSDCSKKLDLKGASLVVSYHMLEHLSDPLVAIRKIYESMDSAAFFHVEIPIETGFPRIQSAHMFPFHPSDIAHMLVESGFNILTKSNQKTRSGRNEGDNIERYMARKI